MKHVRTDLSEIRAEAGRKGGKAPHKTYIRGLAAMPKWKRNKISKLGVEARNDGVARHD